MDNQLPENYRMLNGRPMPECVRVEYNKLTRLIEKRESVGLDVELYKNDRHRLFLIALDMSQENG